ncbi:DUF4440 domain-containing protein [Amphiplicatus metriothermophilus]|uniref:DUF4440 domain-containing protein n=1 Tax=Amphiplicatus metriothermophilus TaxID=1519374 RepID=A0A239PQB3_9PROT|nr:DUF4440 domain-containing protein [Amphiplicatus metriothermophilus]MBB5518357.1 uncharacterized protein (TIGR02246 family) [Amphiplicatus metriothermophilus]SNT72474.1 conserved hypothetical protein [Amphiplicatus metriothermophilus]
MRRIMLCAGLGVAAAGAAQAETATQKCVRGEDERTISVLVPGEVGAACDVRYVRDAGTNVSVPYHADNDAGFCGERARALAASLVAAGFTCGKATPADLPAEAGVREEAAFAEGLPAGEPPANATSSEPSSEPSEDEPPILDSFGSEALAPPPSLDSPRGDGPGADAVPADATLPDELADGARISGEPSDPARGDAMRGPTPLTPTPAAAAEGQVRTAPREVSAGKLVGASPEEPPITPGRAPDTIEPRFAEDEPVIPETTGGEDQSPETIISPAAPPVADKPARPARLRSAPEVIRATLEAQAAAWNDGDLEAFMKVYWNSPDMRFVSGSSVSRGWAAALKRYRERYGQGDSLGYLSFENLDVQMIEDDVAIVVGRFLLERAEGNGAGAFTLVMRRIDGAWRIVHDHTVADAPPAAVAIKD